MARSPENRKFVAHIGVVVALSLGLGACSWVPDWANPVEWYRDTTDWIWGDDNASAERRARADARKKENEIPGKGEAYPSLSSVPERPADIASARDRARIEGSLAADRKQARHAALSSGDALPRRARIPGAPPPPVIAPPPAPHSGVASGSRRLATAPVLTPPPMAPVPGASGQGIVNETMRRAVAQQNAGTVAPPPIPAITPIAPVAKAAPAPETMTERSLAAPVAKAPPVRRNTLPVPPAPRGTIKLKAPPPPARFAAGTTVAPSVPAQRLSAVTLQVGVVHFRNGSSKVLGKYTNELKRIIKIHKEKGGTVRVVGHASSRTRDVDPYRHRLANFRLSMDRANQVAKRLVRYGIPANRVTVMAMADNQPIYHEFMPAGEAGNRRAEIYLDY